MTLSGPRPQLESFFGEPVQCFANSLSLTLPRSQMRRVLCLPPRVGDLLTAEASPTNITTSATRAVGVVATMMWHALSRPCSDCFHDARMDELVTSWFGEHFVRSLRASHLRVDFTSLYETKKGCTGKPLR